MKDIDLDREVAADWSQYLQEVKKMREMIIWIWQELISQKGKDWMYRTISLIVLSCLVGLFFPFAMGHMTNVVSGNGKNLHWLMIWVASYGALLIVRRYVRYLQGFSREYLMGENIERLDCRTTELFLEKSLGTHSSENNYLCEANVKKGHERVLGVEGMLLFEGIEGVLNIAWPLISLCVFSVVSGQWFIGISTMLILVSHVIWSFFLNRKVLMVCLPIDKMWRFLNRYKVERWSHVERVKTNAKEKEEVKTINELFWKALHPDRKFWLWFIKQDSLRGLLTDMIFYFSIMVFCVLRVYEDKMSMGVFWFLSAWGAQLINNLWSISHIEHQLNFYTPSILAMKEALTLPIGISIPSDPMRLPPLSECRIEFQNVSYDYTGSEKVEDEENDSTALHDVSFVIETGQKVALIGPSGAGKTTVMKLLLRYMDPSDGKILINGIDLRQIKLGSWLSQVGYVPQQFEIFDGTIRYNLTYGLLPEEREKINDEKIWELMKVLQIDFGDRLTDGLDTKIGYNGIKLSGGQNQRLMIGAAALKKPRFMIIDEATSSLDATTEKLVQRGLEKVLQNCGALIVTHRLNAVRRICDKFIMLDKQDGSSGKISTIANSFEELASKSTTFASLAKDQGIVL